MGAVAESELIGETEQQQTQADGDNSDTWMSSALPACWGRLIPLPPNKSPIIELRGVQILLGKGNLVNVKFDDPRIRPASFSSASLHLRQRH